MQKASSLEKLRAKICITKETSMLLYVYNRCFAGRNADDASNTLRFPSCQIDMKYRYLTLQPKCDDFRRISWFACNRVGGDTRVDLSQQMRKKSGERRYACHRFYWTLWKLDLLYAESAPTKARETATQVPAGTHAFRICIAVFMLPYVFCRDKNSADAKWNGSLERPERKQGAPYWRCFKARDMS